MSVHAKKRIPPHKHFKDEVVEARTVRPNRPAYEGTHASDVVIDSTLLLSQTIVEWTRLWEEDTFTKDAKVTIVADAKAKNGYSAKIPSDQGDITEPIDTPIFTGEISGDIYVIFCLRVGSNTSGSNLCKLRLAASGAERKGLWIKPSDFPASDQYRHFAIRARIHADDTNVYADINSFTGGITELYVDFIGIVPANVPLDFADVTVESTDPSSAADSTDPSSAGDSTDPSSTGDSEDPSTSAVNDAAGKTYTLIATPASAHADVVDGAGWTNIYTSAVASSPANTDNMALVDVRIDRGSDGDAPHGSGELQIEVQMKVGEVYTTLGAFFTELNPDVPTHIFKILAPYDLSGDQIRVRGRKAGGGGSTSINVYYCSIWQFVKHTHAIQNDSHGHTISGDAHPHTISGDAHPHTISGDSHAHTDVEGGHEH